MTVKTIPEMIIFDYGNTLVYEDLNDNEKSFERIYKYIIKNPKDIKIEDLYKEFRTEKIRALEIYHEKEIDPRYQDVMRLVFEKHRIEFSISYQKIEELYFDDYAPAHTMPYIEEFLEFCEEQNIRTAVLSNISISEESLKKRINKHVKNNFEFMISTCEYMYRKPNRKIYDLAVGKSKISRDKIWYLGDNPRMDIEGANNAGIFPVWLVTDKVNHFRHEEDFFEPRCDYLKVNGFLELENFLKNKIGG